MLLLALVPAIAAVPASVPYAQVPGGPFRSALPVAPKRYDTVVKPFELQVRPVTNADFLRFVSAHPEWDRDHIAPVFADTGYLSHWENARSLGAGALPDQPVTRVSWFAAQAYCEADGARLPTWYEWEFAAAAGDADADARGDALWRQRILDWYSLPASAAPVGAVGQHPANFYGVQDLHGLVWEWVEDAGSLMTGEDNRAAGDPDLLKFCGSGALTLEQKDNYAVMMRIAMLSSLKAADTTRSLGFRCARSPGRP